MKFVYILTDQKGVFIRAVTDKEWAITLATQRLREYLYKHPDDKMTLERADIPAHINSMEKVWSVSKTNKDPMIHTLHTTDCRSYCIYLQMLE
jgi:hypothetical protein